MIPDRIKSHLFTCAECQELIGPSKHSACLVYKNRIICTGVSRLKTHPLQYKFQNNKKKIYLHAEIDCLVRGINLHSVEFLKDCTMYILRISRGGFIRNSKPCSGCQRALDAFGLKKVIWT